MLLSLVNGGWFDVDDERHWPAILQKQGADRKARPQSDVAAEYQAKDKAGAPTGLTLEKLNPGFESNPFVISRSRGIRSVRSLSKAVKLIFWPQRLADF